MIGYFPLTRFNVAVYFDKDRTKHVLRWVAYTKEREIRLTCKTCDDPECAKKFLKSLNFNKASIC